MQANKGPFRRTALINGHNDRRTSTKPHYDIQSISNDSSQQSKAQQRNTSKQQHFEMSNGKQDIHRYDTSQVYQKNRVKQASGVIVWEQFQLTPNLHMKYFCGVCRYHFTSISEFVYHCALVCKEFNHVYSSHMISILPNSKAQIKTAKLQEKLKQIPSKNMRNYRTDLITTIDFMDNSFGEESKPKKKIKPQLQEAQSMTKDQSKKNIKREKIENKQALKLSNVRQYKDILFKIGEQKQEKLDLKIQTSKDYNEIAKCTTKKIEESINSINKTASLFQLQFSPKKKREKNHIEYLEENIRLSKNILATVEDIKVFSNKFIKSWMKATKDHFKLNVTYRKILPSFIFAINPFKINNIKSLKQASDDCVSKSKNCSEIIYKFSRHFLGNCCQYNTQNSTYLIFWSDYFYESLIKTMNENEILQEITKDCGLSKYVYEKTSYSKKIDAYYPNFKYFVGYLHAFNFFKNIIDFCQICRFECPGRFIQLRARNHTKDCALNSKIAYGIEICDEKKYRHLNLNLLNIEDIRAYKFFCPCRATNEMMSAEVLLQHASEHHPQQYIKINLSQMFK